MIRLVRNLRWITTTALSLALVGTACSGPTRTIEEVHFSDYVNPFIGASTNTEAAGAYHGLGKTFPGATTPFGMVQVSPNTIIELHIENCCFNVSLLSCLAIKKALPLNALH